MINILASMGLWPTRISRRAWIAALLSLLMMISVFAWSCRLHNQANISTRNAEIAQRIAQEHRQEAQAADRQIERRESGLQEARDAYTQAVVRTIATVTPETLELLPPAAVPIVQVQMVEIGAGRALVRQLEAQLADMTRARDAWKATAEEERRAASLYRSAAEARLAAAKVDRWRGRLEGALFGGLVGYAGGRK